MNFRPISYAVFTITLLLTSCSQKLYHVAHTQESRIFITDTLTEDKELIHMIAPYKAQMVNELSRVLSYTPIDLNFDGTNSSLGNLVADIMLADGNQLYQKRYPKEKIDVALMNRGGLRRTFSAGNLTVQSIYELMPFENEVVVVKLSGETVYKMVDYLRKSKRNHPIAGIKFSKSAADENIYIGKELLDKNKDYLILTNDYLQKGGDNMTFFHEAKEVEYLNLKLRDMFIQHLEKVDTIHVDMQARYLD